jgi:SAM-dependent methyltransferase
VSRVIARAVWGGDIRPFYASMDAIASVPAGGLIADAPCGAGVAFRGLSPDRPVRYLALDASERMLVRARREAERRGLTQIEIVHGDAESLPLEDASVDLFLSWWGLHCFARPQAAIDEIARCLRPDGRLLGGSIVTGSSPRARLVVRPHHGAFGDVPSLERLSRMLTTTIGETALKASGSLAYFEATRRSDAA